MLWPAETAEPRAELLDQSSLIVATTEGLAAVNARRQASATATHVNIINSTVGQLALQDVHNVNISVILDVVEASLAEVQTPEAVKEEARGVIRRMREPGASVATTAASEVLATALRRSLALG